MNIPVKYNYSKNNLYSSHPNNVYHYVCFYCKIITHFITTSRIMA